MEEFLFKIGIMTQRNHETLIQELRALRASVNTLNEALKATANDNCLVKNLWTA